MAFIDRQLIIGVGFISALAMSVALIVNGFSERGIPFVGQWDATLGVPTARPDPNADEREIKDIESAKKIFDLGQALFIDARPEDVFNEGHVKGAISFPVNEFDDRIAAFIEGHPDENIAIIVYCSGRMCHDSHSLAEDLIAMGYAKIRVMIDGFEGWKEKGYPVEGNL